MPLIKRGSRESSALGRQFQEHRRKNLRKLNTPDQHACHMTGRRPREGNDGGEQFASSSGGGVEVKPDRRKKLRKENKTGAEQP